MKFKLYRHFSVLLLIVLLLTACSSTNKEEPKELLPIEPAAALDEEWDNLLLEGAGTKRAGFIMLSAAQIYLNLPTELQDQHLKAYATSTMLRAFEYLPEEDHSVFELLMAYMEDNELQKASIIYNSLYSKFNAYADGDSLLEPVSEGTGSVAQSSASKQLVNPLRQRDTDVVARQITQLVMEEWDDEEQRDQEFDEQVTAFFELWGVEIQSTVQLEMFEYSLEEWEPHYVFALLEYEEQLEAYDYLQYLLANGPEIMVNVIEFAVEKWEPDYSMAKYEYEKQSEAVKKFSEIMDSPQLDTAKLKRVFDKWGADYRKALIEYEQ